MSRKTIGKIFFQNNLPVRELYTPLFAIYRYDQRSPAETHWSLLWNAAVPSVF